MGMSTHVVGFRPADQHFKNMKAVWDACLEAGIEPPDTVIEFFGDVYPGDSPGQEVDIGFAKQKWSDDNSRTGFQIDIKALPDGVRYLRFYNAW